MAPRRDKKRQSRLSFDPVSPSSKYAGVSYEGSPAKKRRTGQQKLEFDAVRSEGPSSSAVPASAAPLTPLRSSQLERDIRRTLYDSDKEPGEEGERLTDTDSDDDYVSRAPHGGRGQEPSSSIFTRAPIISPKPKEKQQPAKRSSPAEVKPRSKAKKTIELSSDDDEEMESPCKLTPRSSGRTSKAKPKTHVISSDESASERFQHEESEDDIQPITPARRRLATVASEAQKMDDDSDDVRPSTQRRSQKQRNTVASDSENDATPSPRKRLIRRGDAKEITPPSSSTPIEPGTQDGDESDPPPAESSTRKKKKLVRRRSPSLDSEDAEMAAEAKDLKNSTVFHKHKGGRLRDRAGNSKTNDRLNRLEQLKAAREGRRPIQITDDEDEDEDEPLEQLPDSEEEEEDDWLIDDDEEARAREEAGGSTEHLELEMMRHGQRGLKEHFMYVIKSMIASRLNPAEAEELRDLYTTSIRRVNREASGLTDRLVSSAWVHPFVRVLKARPDYEEMELGSGEGVLFGKCSACNRSGHPPKFIIRLKGKAYDTKTLESLKDEDDDGDETSEDEEGHKLVDEDRQWQLGTFCRSNAINAHSLIHWQIHLRDWLNSYMEGEGIFSPEAIVKRDSMSRRKRGELVEQIMDDLERSRQIKRLWSDLKAKLAAAPEVHGQRWGRN